MAILAIALLYMGAQLVAAGGSPAYSIIALVLLATAVLLFLKKKSALTLYAVLMWGILIWIVYEVGFDKWQWIPPWRPVRPLGSLAGLALGRSPAVSGAGT
nr:hypothetical protein [Pseudomonas veronii]